MNLGSKFINLRQKWKEKKVSYFAMEEETKSQNDGNSLDYQINSKSNEFPEETTNELKDNSETVIESTTQDNTKIHNLKQETIEYLVKNKSEIQLPINEMNIANIKNNISTEMTKKKLNELEQLIRNSEDIIEQNKNDIDEIKRKSEILIETSDIAISKFILLENKMDDIKIRSRNRKFQFVDLLLYIFSIISSLFAMLCHNFKKKDKEK